MNIAYGNYLLNLSKIR